MGDLEAELEPPHRTACRGDVMNKIAAARGEPRSRTCLRPGRNDRESMCNRTIAFDWRWLVAPNNRAARL